MINDNDLDLEELESRLYSQVYHTSAEDYENHTSLPSLAENGKNMRRQNIRYFQTESQARRHNNAEYMSFNNDNKDSTDSNRPRAKRRAADFFEAPTVNVENCTDIAISNSIPQIVHMVNPYNNILLLPQLPTQIISHRDYNPEPQINRNLVKYLDRQSKREQAKQKRLERVRQKRKEKKEKLKEMRKLAKDNLDTEDRKANNFKVHYLTTNDESPSHHDKHNKVVTISDSDDDSCIEVPEHRDLVVLSSDESDAEESKYDVNTKVKLEAKVQDNLKIKSEPDNKLNKSIRKNEPAAEDDDDVLFIDDIPSLEIIDIDCDTKSVTNADSNKNSSEKSIETNSTCSEWNKLNKGVNKSVPHKVASTSRERNELLRTPDSASNDFLDNSVDLRQKKFNFGLYGSDFGDNHHFLKPGKPHETSETGSSCSASDNSTPIKNTVFNEVEFDTPNKELFNENNLEIFGDYITPDRDNRSNNSQTNEGLDQGTTKAGKIVTKTQKRLRTQSPNNESDSSSESDYSSQKSVSKVRKVLPDLTTIDSNSNNSPEVSVNIDENTPSKKKQILSVEDTTPLKKVDNDNVRSQNDAREISPICKSDDVGQDKTSQKEMIDENIQIKKDLNKTTPENKDTSEVFYINDDSSSSENTNFSKVESVNNDIQLVNCQTPTSPPKKSRHSKGSNGFAKYWTSDMHKFYNTSWGLEDFSVEEAQKTMSDDLNLWKIREHDRYNFWYGTPRGPRCHRCKEKGHIALHCRNTVKPTVCSLCGELGHLEPRCPNGLCTLCGSVGGFGTYCSYCARWRTKRCSVCQMYGHIDEKCPDLWRRYHLTTQPGPIVKPLKANYKLLPDRWCSGCGQSGHFEYKCRYYQRSHHAVDPYIKEYIDLYNFPKTQPFLIHCDLTSPARLPVENIDSNKITEEANDNTTKVTDKDNLGPSTVDNVERDNTISQGKSNKINTENFMGSDPKISFDNYIFPPIDMIPPYFRDQITFRESRYERSNERNDREIMVPSPSTSATPNRQSPAKSLSTSGRHSSTQKLSAHSFGYIRSVKGIDIINEIRQRPNISLIINRNNDEETCGGTITICGNAKEVREMEKKLHKFFTTAPTLDNIPRFSKAVYNLLSQKLEKVETIGSNFQDIYNQLVNLQIQLTKGRGLSQMRKKIKETKIHLNMILFGKLRLGLGQKHMDALHHWLKLFEGKTNYKIPLNELYDIVESYSYIFLDTVNHDYPSFCVVQPNENHSTIARISQNDMRNLYKLSSTVELKCRRFNLLDKLEELNYLRSCVYRSFSVKDYKQFRTFCERLMHYFKTTKL